MRWSREGWVFVVATAALLACGGERERESGRANRLTIAYPFENPFSPIVDEVSKFLVFSPLVMTNEEGELEARLARGWKHSPDYREWTFHLRTDVRWHDGAPVTARDVAFTLELLSHPDVTQIGDVDAVSVLDDSTITVRIGNAYAVRQFSWLAVLPEHLLGNLDPATIADWDFWLRPIGSGPYRFARHIPHTLMELEANPSHFGGTPRIERVALRFLDGGGMPELLAGDVDVLYATSPMHLGRLARDPRFSVYHAYDDDIYALLWNNDYPLFRDARARRALTLAIDREELRQVLDLPSFVPVLDGPYTVRHLARGDLPTPLPHDTAGARDLLRAAGWADENGDGVLDRDGVPFRFSVIFRSEPLLSELAVYIREQLRRVDVDMEIHGYEAGAGRGRIGRGEFEAALVRGTWGPQWWNHAFGDSAITRYRDPRALELLRRLVDAVDPREEDRIRRELTEIFQTDVPATFFFPYLATVVVDRRLRGLESPWRADPLLHIEELWLEQEGS